MVDDDFGVEATCLGESVKLLRGDPPERGGVGWHSLTDLDVLDGRLIGQPGHLHVPSALGGICLGNGDRIRTLVEGVEHECSPWPKDVAQVLGGELIEPVVDSLLAESDIP